MAMYALAVVPLIMLQSLVLVLNVGNYYPIWDLILDIFSFASKAVLTVKSNACWLLRK